MVFSTKAVLPLLLAGTAVAGSGSRQFASRYRQAKAASLGNFSEDATGETLGTYDFTNWAGAFLDTTDVTSVTGTFTVPTPSIPSGGDSSTDYCGCAWVGIDGISNFCSGGLMQAGVNWCIENGETSYQAWYEWYPAEAQQYWDDISVSAGDVITVSVTASSTTGGSTTLENTSNGESVTYTWSGESPALCEVTAEWIVEDFSVSDSLVAFADYGSVTFTGNSAVVGGSTVGLDNAYLADMVSESDSSDIISSSSVSGNDITVTYQ
jgi:Peptidase A4 family